jgi:hypothetical protein
MNNPVPIPIIDIRYQRGKIYYIYSPSNPEDKFYIGSTIETVKCRFGKHKSKYKRWLAGKPDSYCASYEILKFGDAVIFKLEDYFCNNELELKLREKATIKLNRARCVNKNTPAPTTEERKATDRAYRQSHAQEIKATKQEYSQIYVICECGQNVNKSHKARHMQTQKHIRAMANITQ